MINRVARAGLALSSVLALAACGGGGGGGSVGSIPAPPAAVQPPAPAPSPTPAASFETAEYLRSSGLQVSNVLPAYQAGATGRGVTVAVIDSGVAETNPEFAGRISPASTDVVGSRGITDQGGHGTAVSSVLLGAKNDSGTHGVAFGATLLALRSDSLNSCTGPQGECTHSDAAIARALDIATAQGARVANLSLGGSAPGPSLRAAVQRATAAGMVIVISAGNESEANPSPFAVVLADPVNGRGQVIIAGAYDQQRAIVDFSNRAGVGAQSYLTALGRSVRSIDETGQTFLYSGTSFSAPHIAGAAALLAQAFPNLTGAQITELLLTSADDLGAAGTDPVYGRGGLNIGRAFAPRGAASLAGSAIPLTLGAATATLSPAMGDAARSGAGLGAVMLDGYNRAYDVDLGGAIAAARPNPMLAASLAQPPRTAMLARGQAAAGLSLAAAPLGLGEVPDNQMQLRMARGQSGWVAAALDARTSVALGFGQSGASLSGQLAGRAEPGFLFARSGADALGFDRRSGGVASLRHSLGRWGLSVAAESGEAFVQGGDPRRPFERAPYALMSAGVDRRFGPVALAGGLSLLDERETVLGGRFGPVFGGGGAESWFADVRADWAMGGGWSLGASARQGWTRMAAGGALAGAPGFRSNAFAFDLGKADLFRAGDAFALRVAQPLRVAGGGLDLRLPVDYDYATGGVTWVLRRLSLTPTGRELDLEASYGFDLIGGRMAANLFWRRDPGHIAAFPDDIGAAVRWRVGF